MQPSNDEVENVRDLRATKSGQLFDTSFSKFQWDKLEQLTLHDCRKDIQPSMLRSAKETITTLEFVGSTNFRNLRLLLMHCKQLASLTLYNIALIKHPPMTNSGLLTPPMTTREDLKLLRLAQLSMNGLGPLTLDEQYLLGYFSRKCHTPNLNLVSFELRQSRGLIYTALNSLHGGDPDSPILAEFLAKNRATVKSVTLERTAVSLNVDNNAGIAEKLGAIRLTELTCSMGTIGADKILQNQRELETLNCYSSPYSRTCHFESVIDAIQRSSSTLQAVRLSHKVVFNDSDVSLGNVPSAVAHNCSVYEDCSTLCHLSLSLSIFSDPARSRMKPGSIINLHLLPRTLKTIILRFDILSSDQIRLFVRVLPEFRVLGLFLATGNPEMPFTARFDWVQTLIDLPNMTSFELTNCDIDDVDHLRAYIAANPEIGERIEVGPDSIVYRRSIN